MRPSFEPISVFFNRKMGAGMVAPICAEILFGHICKLLVNRRGEVPWLGGALPFFQVDMSLFSPGIRLTLHSGILRYAGQT